MTADETVLFLIACYGATQILTTGRIFNRIRPVAKFFHCPMCVGFHVGWLFYFFGCFWGLWPSRSWFEFFLFACAASGVSYFLGMLVNDDGLRVRGKNADKIFDR